MKDIQNKLEPCSDCGMLHLIFPIPSCISGCWYRRQWDWYGILLKRLICVFRGHRLVVRRYDYHRQEDSLPHFDAVECDYCSERFGIVKDYEQLEEIKRERARMKAFVNNNFGEMKV